MSFSSFSTPLILTFMGCTLGVRLCPRSGSSDMSSWVKTEQNWSPMMLALFRLSEKVSPSFFSGATPVLSVSCSWPYLRSRDLLQTPERSEGFTTVGEFDFEH